MKVLPEMKSGEPYWSGLAGRYESIMDEVIDRAFRKKVFCRIEDIGLAGDALEIGCGTGYFTPALARGADRVLATDISKLMLDKAGNRLSCMENVSLMMADCLRLPFRDGSFDSVLMANVIKFIDDPKKAICECYRVLRPGGRLAVMYFSEHAMGLTERANFYRRLLLMLKRPPTFQVRAPVEVKRLAVSTGFRIETDEAFGGGLKAILLVCTKDVKPYEG